MPPTYTTARSWDGRPANASAKAPRKLTEMWYVTTDTPGTISGKIAIEVLGAVESIFIGTSHPEWAYALVTSFDPQPDPDDPSTFNVTIQYEEPVPQPGTVHGTSGGSTAPAEPTARAPEVSTGYRLEPEYRLVDLDGVGFRNPAGDMFEDVPPRSRGIGIIKFVKYYASWNDYLGLLMLDTVNLTTWNSKPADTCKITGIDAAAQTEKGRVFWKVAFVVEFKPEKWIPLKVLNAGRRVWQIIDGVGRPVPVTDIYGRDHSGVVLLDTDGSELEGGVETYTSFRMNNRFEFNSL